MLTRPVLLVSVLLITFPGLARDKKDVLPDFVLKARSVRVIARPDSGVALDNPTANTEAVEQVVRALDAWGRFTLVSLGQDADLVIVIRPGSKSFVSPTLEKGPSDTRVGTVQPGTGRVGIGAQEGRGPAMSDPTFDPKQTGPHLGKNIGRTKDTFAVYHGGAVFSLDSMPVWQYTAKDALKAPIVPAVEKFRKAISEAEKQHP